MNTIAFINPAVADGKTKELFEVIEKRNGQIPNMIRGVDFSPSPGRRLEDK